MSYFVGFFDKKSLVFQRDLLIIEDICEDPLCMLNTLIALLYLYNVYYIY